MTGCPVAGLPCFHQKCSNDQRLASGLLTGSLHEVMFARTLERNFATATDDDLREAFNDWNSRVISNVPAQRLLIYNPKDGWGPLSGPSKPKMPFPHVNKRENMTTVLKNQLSRGVFFDRLIFNRLMLKQVSA